MKSLSAALCICLSVLIVGCEAFDNQNPDPVRVIAPQKGTILQVGQNFTVEATIATHYRVIAAEIRLWKVSTKSGVKWLVQNSTLATTFVVNQTLQVPDDISPGEYRLEVNALHGSNLDGVVGYAVPVWVNP